MVNWGVKIIRDSEREKREIPGCIFDRRRKNLEIPLASRLPSFSKKEWFFVFFKVHVLFVCLFGLGAASWVFW